MKKYLRIIILTIIVPISIIFVVNIVDLFYYDRRLMFYYFKPYELFWLLFCFFPIYINLKSLFPKKESKQGILDYEYSTERKAKGFAKLIIVGNILFAINILYMTANHILIGLKLKSNNSWGIEYYILIIILISLFLIILFDSANRKLFKKKIES